MPFPIDPGSGPGSGPRPPIPMPHVRGASFGR